MSNSEFTANDELANTPKPRRANPEQVALVAKNRAALARRRAIRTAITGTIAGALLAATAVFWAHSIVSKITDWRAERNVGAQTWTQANHR